MLLPAILLFFVSIGCFWGEAGISTHNAEDLEVSSDIANLIQKDIKELKLEKDIHQCTTRKLTVNGLTLP